MYKDFIGWGKSWMGEFTGTYLTTVDIASFYSDGAKDSAAGLSTKSSRSRLRITQRAVRSTHQLDAHLHDIAPQLKCQFPNVFC